MAIVTTEDVDLLMKRCQVGVGGRGALEEAHEIMAECYGTLGALVQERDRLQAIESAPDVRAPLLERLVSRLEEVEEYLREEADFNRSWTDGRRGASMVNSERYIAARITAANLRDEWADATSEAKKYLKIIIA